MCASKICLIAGVTLVLSLGTAQAASRVFGDSVLNRTDNLSEEVTGQGPELVFVAGTESPDELRAAVRELRRTNRVHLIRMTEGGNDAAHAAALRAYLDKRHLTEAPLAGSGAALAHS